MFIVELFTLSTSRKAVRDLSYTYILATKTAINCKVLFPALRNTSLLALVALYNYRLCKHCLDVNITACEELNDDDPDVS